jgi:hypothetical protein
MVHGSLAETQEVIASMNALEKWALFETRAREGNA